jgi:hypothetical protein
MTRDTSRSSAPARGTSRVSDASAAAIATASAKSDAHGVARAITSSLTRKECARQPSVGAAAAATRDAPMMRLSSGARSRFKTLTTEALLGVMGRHWRPILEGRRLRGASPRRRGVPKPLCDHAAGVTWPRRTYTNSATDSVSGRFRTALLTGRGQLAREPWSDCSSAITPRTKLRFMEWPAPDFRIAAAR